MTCGRSFTTLEVLFFSCIISIPITATGTAPRARRSWAQDLGFETASRRHHPIQRPRLSAEPVRTERTAAWRMQRRLTIPAWSAAAICSDRALAVTAIMGICPVSFPCASYSRILRVAVKPSTISNGKHMHPHVETLGVFRCTY